MELREALTQIEEIRLHLARTETFRGFKAAPIALSACLAVGSAVVQAVAIPKPDEALSVYIVLWSGTAAVSALAAGLEMYSRMARVKVRLLRETNLLAVEQFFPSLVAGAITTAAILTAAPEHAVLLPGLWSIFFGLGVLACWRLLPKPIFFVGLYYLFSGAVILAWARGEHAFSPWAMAAAFGVGQAAAATVFHYSQERDQ